MAICKQEGEASPETNSAGTLTLLDLGLPIVKGARSVVLVEGA